MKTTFVAAWLAVMLTGALTPAHAGRSCEQRPLTAASLERGLSLAERTAKALDGSGARVAVLARAGQDLSRYGLAWSHLGLAYRDPSSGHWRVVHKLNHCATAIAVVYRQGLGEFFLDDPWRYEAAFVPIEPAYEARIVEVLRDDVRATRLHSAAYSLVAYPWSQTYQQSNQWLIETLAMALDDNADTRERAQAWLRLKDYQPTTLHLNALTRLGARVGSANVAFDDHPNHKRFGDRIETVSADSVLAWLPRAGIGGSMQVLR